MAWQLLSVFIATDPFLSSKPTFIWLLTLLMIFYCVLQTLLRRRADMIATTITGAALMLIIFIKTPEARSYPVLALLLAPAILALSFPRVFPPKIQIAPQYKIVPKR